MERLKELINQLNEQFDRKAEPARLLDTARLLEAELQLLASQPAPARVMPTKIAVMMPSATKMYAGSRTIPETPPQPAPAAAPVTPEPRKEVKKEPPVAIPAPIAADSPHEVSEDTGDDTPGNIPDSRYMPPVTPVPASPHVPAPVPAPVAVAAATLEKPPARGVWPFDPLAEKPIDRFTLSQRSKEVNDVIGTNGASSLNDKLKSEVADLKSALNDTPVRDLRKAIGVNDRYVFINQLFRGDEVMYERSLKTINGFRILPEADYWMERELKVKLGWDENREATRHFYQLVKRRFS